MMDEEVRDLLQRTVKDLVTLEIALFFHAHPDYMDSREGLCLRLACEPPGVEKALDGLAQAGILELFELGEGRYKVYSYTRNRDKRTTIQRLDFYYHDDPNTRAEIVRHLIANSIQPSEIPVESGK